MITSSSLSTTGNVLGRRGVVPSGGEIDQQRVEIRPENSVYLSLVIGHYLPLPKKFNPQVAVPHAFPIYFPRPGGPNYATPPFWLVWNLRSAVKSEAMITKQVTAELLDGNFATAGQLRCKNHGPGSMVRKQDRAQTARIRRQASLNVATRWGRHRTCIN